MDESYTPSKISIRSGTTFHDLQVTILGWRYTVECLLSYLLRIGNQGARARYTGRLGYHAFDATKVRLYDCI